MDPRKAECLGLYLYGAGYFARDQNTLGMIRGERTARHFCLDCPQRVECEDEHEKRVRELAPESAENFDRYMREGQKRDLPPTLVALKLAERGLDPFAATAVDNFNRGHGDRGVIAGPLVKPRASE